MRDLYFVENSRLGRCVFRCDDHQIEITRTQFGRKAAGSVELATVNPEYVVITARLPALWIPALVLSVISLGLTWLLIHQRTFPRDAAIFPAMLSPFFLWHLARAVPRIHIVRFFSRTGAPAIDVVRGDRASEEFTGFIAALAERIRSCAR